MFTPADYELLVANHFRSLGYTATVTPQTGDYGLDVLAENKDERIAIQAKMYGGTARRVNRQTMMELFGVAAFFDCTQAVLATNGGVLPDAVAVAAKLGIKILQLEARTPQTVSHLSHASPENPLHPAAAPLQHTFDTIWAEYIMPLAGTTLTRQSGDTNRIVAVDWSGLTRVTSNGRTSRIDIEIFRLAVRHVLTHGSITRSEVNDNYAKRASSGVMLVLSQVPVFTLDHKPVQRLRYTPDSA